MSDKPRWLLRPVALIKNPAASPVAGAGWWVLCSVVFLTGLWVYLENVAMPSDVHPERFVAAIALGLANAWLYLYFRSTRLFAADLFTAFCVSVAFVEVAAFAWILFTLPWVEGKEHHRHLAYLWVMVPFVTFGVLATGLEHLDSLWLKLHCFPFQRAVGDLRILQAAAIGVGLSAVALLVSDHIKFDDGRFAFISGFAFLTGCTTVGGVYLTYRSIAAYRSIITTFEGLVSHVSDLIEDTR